MGNGESTMPQQNSISNNPQQQQQQQQSPAMNEAGKSTGIGEGTNTKPIAIPKEATQIAVEVSAAKTSEKETKTTESKSMASKTSTSTTTPMSAAAANTPATHDASKIHSKETRPVEMTKDRSHAPSAQTMNSEPDATAAKPEPPSPKKPDTDSALDPNLGCGLDDKPLPVLPTPKRRKRPAAKTIVPHRIARAYAPASSAISSVAKKRKITIDDDEVPDAHILAPKNSKLMSTLPLPEAVAVAVPVYDPVLPGPPVKVTVTPTPNPIGPAPTSKHTVAKKNAAAKDKKTTLGKKSSQPANVEIWSGVPDDPLPGGWPPGWTKKVFERRSQGIESKGGRDRYWYTPQHQLKLRSMLAVKRFMEMLQTTNGDEKEAFKRIKK